MNYSIGANVVLSILLGVLGFFYKDSLKEQERLRVQLVLEGENTSKLHKALQLQNEAYKGLMVVKSESPPQKERIEKVFIKDESCKAELEAYKQLFKELGQPP